MPEDVNALLTKMRDELKSFMGRNNKELQDVVRRMDSMEVNAARPRGGTYDEPRSGLPFLLKQLADNRETFQKSGRLILEVGSLLPPIAELKTITSTGIVPYSAEPAIEPTGRKTHRLRSFMRSDRIEAASVAFVRETAFTNQASPQIEAQAKQESTFTFELLSRAVATIAHWTSASRQVLDDLVELEQHIRSGLLWGLEEKVESQLLTGDGLTNNLEGLLTVATAFDSTLLTASDGWEKVDVLRAAALQLEEAGYQCTGYVVSPRDWRDIEVAKDSTGRYIVGSPTGQLTTTVWGIPVCVSGSMASGTFLAGDFSRASIRQRMNATVDISTEHSTYFTENKVAIRCEERLASVIRRPEAFITGSTSTSPA